MSLGFVLVLRSPGLFNLVSLGFALVLRSPSLFSLWSLGGKSKEALVPWRQENRSVPPSYSPLSLHLGPPLLHHDRLGRPSTRTKSPANAMTPTSLLLLHCRILHICHEQLRGSILARYNEIIQLVPSSYQSLHRPIGWLDFEQLIVPSYPPPHMSGSIESAQRLTTLSDQLCRHQVPAPFGTTM